jgi:hypothetical protein
MNEHDDNENHDEHNDRHPIIDAIIAGLVVEAVKFLVQHAATIAAGYIWILHHLPK